MLYNSQNAERLLRSQSMAPFGPIDISIEERFDSELISVSPNN